MRLEARKLLHDVITASHAIEEFTRGRTVSECGASVWDVTRTKLPLLIGEVETLLAEEPPKP